MFIGITGYNHESSVALVDESGNLINYYREESLSRIKGDKSFPKRSLQKIIKENNLGISDIQSLAFYERPLTAFLTPLGTAALNIPHSLGLITNQCRNFAKSSISCFLDISKIYPGLEKKLMYLDHHLSHTLTAYAYSHIQNNLCSIVIDGFGDRSTASISKVNNLYDIKELWSCDYPVSLGLFYSAITDFLGFQVNEGEYKVMGLSSFGDPDSHTAKKVSELVDWDSNKFKILLDMSYFSYHTSPTNSYSPKLASLLGSPRNPYIPLNPADEDFQYFADIARGAQEGVVKVLSKIFHYAHNICGTKDFLFSGGVAMNSAALDKLASLPNVNNIIVPPSPGDAGSAIGSAYYALLKSQKKMINSLPKPSLFPCCFDYENQNKLAKDIISKNFQIITASKEESISISCKLIKEGNVIGTILNNAETGPRALGNRSLICDGKNKDAVRILNTIIKNRSPFRPTAPCMKLEVARKYYILRDELMGCYETMSATCKCKENSEALNFPTTHIDSTARLQVVNDGQFLFKILTELETFKIDILANSSFNLSGDPTCFDLIDALMVSARNPLKYILTDFGLLKSIT